MKKRLKLTVVVGLILLLIFSAGCGGEEKAVKEEETNSSTQEEITSIEVFGTVKVKEKETIHLDLPARVEKIHVSNGERVKKGDKLVTLDLSQAAAELEHKRDLLKSAENKLNHLTKSRKIKLEELNSKLQTEEKLYEREKQKLKEKRIELEEKSSPDIKKLVSNLKIKKEFYQQAKDDLAKKKKLLAKEAISRQEVEDYKQIVEQKKQEVEQAKLSLKELKYNKSQEIEELERRLIKREETITELKLQQTQFQADNKQDYLSQQAEVERLKQEVKQLETKLNRDYFKGDEIVANVEKGVVYNIGYEEGDIITTEQKLLTIMDLEKIIVEADVPEEFIIDVKQGAKATIFPLASAEKSYQGRVVKIKDMAVERGGETVVPIEISLIDLDDFIRPNFNVDVEIEK